MAYQAIQPAAFVPNPETEGLHAQIYTLNFPSSWRAPILELYKHGKSDRAQTKLQQVPIKRLNAIMRAVAPDLVAADANASFDDTSPWLYFDAKFPPRAMESLVNAWLRDMQPSPEAYPLLKKAKDQLNLSALPWQHQDIDLLQHAISPGNTCLPESHLFRLLPEILATRIEQLPPYEHCGSPVSFTRVAVDARANGAELMSWPPLPYQNTNKDGTTRTWHYSAVINLSLRTVPFSPIPQIYLSTSIRRWVTGRIWIPAKGSVSTYLLTTKSFLPDGPDPHRFAVARLAYDYKTSKTQWAQGGPEGMLVQVKALENLPTADVFVKEPEAWLKGQGGVTAGVAYHTRMGWHEVGAGIMPTERRRLFEWASQALEPEFKPIDEFRRSSVKPDNPGRILEKPAPVSKKATDDERAAQVEENEQVHARNAVHRRARVAAAVGERGLTVIAVYQTDTMLSHLINAAEVSLGLANHRLETGPTTWSWNTPDFTLRIHARQLGALGAPLGDDNAPRRGEDFDQAISARRAEVTASLSLLSSDVHDTAQIAFVELEGAEQFKKTRTDPKFAIRLGCADAGTVSQFLQPPNSAKREDNAAFRAAAAWEDGLRQVGMRLTPEHTLGTAIPDDLNQLAFWLVKRRVDSQTNQAQFTPVAVLVRPGQQCIMGKTSDMAEWVPYPDLLKAESVKLFETVC